MEEEIEQPETEQPVATPASRIRTISYKRLWNTGDYTNVSIFATMEIAEGDDPAQAFAALRNWVDGQGPQYTRWGTSQWEDPEEIERTRLQRQRAAEESQGHTSDDPMDADGEPDEEDDDDDEDEDLPW